MTARSYSFAMRRLTTTKMTMRTASAAAGTHVMSSLARPSMSCQKLPMRRQRGNDDARRLTRLCARKIIGATSKYYLHRAAASKTLSAISASTKRPSVVGAVDRCVSHGAAASDCGLRGAGKASRRDLDLCGLPNSFCLQVRAVFLIAALNMVGKPFPQEI